MISKQIKQLILEDTYYFDEIVFPILNIISFSTQEISLNSLH